MTPTLEPVTSDAPVAADRLEALEALIDTRIAIVFDQYDQQWAGLHWSVRDWLREVLLGVLRDVRQDVLAVMHDLLMPLRVH